MIVKLVRPKNEVLRQFIQYFFFLRNDNKTYCKTHVCYPNTNYCLGLLKDNRLTKLTDTTYEVLSSVNYHSYLTGIYLKPIHILYQGCFSEVCIEFEPLGLEMVTGNKISRNVFIPDVIEFAFPRSYSTLYDLAFYNDDPHLCAARLEEFFLQHLPSRNKVEFIPFNRINTCRVEDLKDVYCKSYRSIYRLYKDSLNISPKEFLKIQRLRRSIQQIHISKKSIQIANDENFSDQSHMIREFQKYTGLSPKAFQNQSSLINETLCWTLK